MVKWEALNRPKDYGGLGFMDVRVMNICLMCKWIDKKYLGNKSIFQIKRKRGSHFWRSLLDLRTCY
jgi:hypothetical protein